MTRTAVFIDWLTQDRSIYYLNKWLWLGLCVCIISVLVIVLIICQRPENYYDNISIKNDLNNASVSDKTCNVLR